MQILNRIISITLSLAMFMLPLGVAQSAMIDNAQLIGSHANDRTALLQKLNREEVRDYLSGMGVDADQVKQRVAQMTDQEVATLNQRVGELPAGGDALGVVLLVFIVFIITDAIGATDIFPFVHPVR
ncbi:MAG: PA2779 family protein [Candidatus Thiodiazotropha sp.]